MATPTEQPINPPSLPQYPELILAAIEAVNDPNGANKSTISNHIEATYGNLPAAHTTLLSHHLNKMKASAQLVMVKNNYLIPDPNSPPRRGRGRPPKQKDPLPPNAVVSPPLPRGRPPKQKDPLPPNAVVSPPRPRGRPPKSRNPLPVKPTSESGKKRGRPPKLGKTMSLPVKTTSASGVKRGRGRPPKAKAPVGA